MRHRHFLRCSASSVLGASSVLAAAASAVLIGLGGARGTAAAGDTYLPLVVGNRWTYQIATGGIEVVTVDRELTVLGLPAFVLVHRIDGVPVQEDFWSEREGDVFFHGFYRSIKDFGLLYAPPIRAVDAPLDTGRTWSTAVEIFLLPDTTSLGNATFTFKVLAEETIEVPAGSFPAFDIDQTAAPLPDRGSFPRRWVALNLGTVRFDEGGVRDLESYSVIVPVEAASWGRLKWSAAAGRWRRPR